MTASLAFAWLASTATVRAAEPAFPIRGVVLAHYGSVWTHAERMDMIRWLATHGLNTFVYTPQEDPYTRERWRQPFPDDAMAQFAEEIRLARSLGVRWGIGTRPGRPLFPDTLVDREICFTCDGDFQALAAKYQRFYDLGVRVLRLSVDDGVKASSHPEDLGRFGVGDAAYARMNAFLANRLQRRFPDSLVIFGPADYSGTEPTEYLTALGQALLPEIRVIWTGPQVGSTTITAADADAFADAVSPPGGPRRRLVITENYPVNDVHGEAYSAHAPVREQSTGAPERPPSLRLNFGPLKLRGADLVGHVEGILSNPMNQPQSSKVALYTVAAYLNDPRAYTADPVSCPYNPSERTRAGCLSEKKWLEGIRELGRSAGDDLLAVVSQMRSTRFDRTDAPRFVARRDALVDAFAGPHWEAASSALMEELRAERNAGRALRVAKLPSPEFVEETANHLNTLELNTTAGLLAAEMLRAQRPTFESVTVKRHSLTVAVAGRAVRADQAAVVGSQAELAPVEARARSSPFSVHGDRADFGEVILSGSTFLLENRMDEFLDWAHETTAAWLPLAPLAAAGSLEVTVNGAPAAVAPDGTFSAAVTLAPGRKAVELVVTDAAGFRTARSYAAGQ